MHVCSNKGQAQASLTKRSYSERMGRILALIIGIGVLAFVVTKTLNRTAAGTANTGGAEGVPSQVGTPKQRLDNVRQAAKRIENNDQQRAEEMLNKAGAAEGLGATTTE